MTSEVTKEKTKASDETATTIATTQIAVTCPVCTKGFNGTLWDCGCYLMVLDRNTTKRSSSALPWHEADLNCVDIGDDSHLLGELFQYNSSSQ